MTKVLITDPIDQTGIDILSQVAQVDQKIGISDSEFASIIKDSPILFNPMKLKVDKLVILEKAMPAIKPKGISHLAISACLIFLSSFGLRTLIFSILSDLK